MYRKEAAVVAHYGIPENPALRTNSRIRMWWLQNIRGYQVLTTHRQRRAGWFGATYDNVYLLLPRSTRHA